MRQLKSCGVILFREDPVLSFLLMKHSDRWDLPKGHVDEGETELQCDLREMEEETGIPREAVRIDETFRFAEVYHPIYKPGETIEKTLVIFLGWLDEDLPLTLTEHAGHEWLPWTRRTTSRKTPSTRCSRTWNGISPVNRSKLDPAFSRGRMAVIHLCKSTILAGGHTMLLASRIVSLIGGAGFFVASFLTWFWGESNGIRRTEIAWQGEYSLGAVICFLLAMTLLAVGWALPKTWLPLGIVELILVIVSFGLTIIHMLHNSQPVVVYGRTIPTGIGAGPWVGLFASVVMIVGSILNLCSGGPFRALVEDEDDEYEDDRPRRRRPPRRRDWD